MTRCSESTPFLRGSRADLPAKPLEIKRMGRRGEGLAETAEGRIYVPYALPDEMVLATCHGERGILVEVLAPNRERIAPFCRYFGSCGGCAIQHWADAPYAAWKRNLLVDALHRAGVTADIGPLIDAHGAGRRRATFHARVEPGGAPSVGFMRARAHEIVSIDDCPILDPGLAGALPAARAVAEALAGSRKPLDMIASATDTGIDLDIHGHGPLAERARAALVEIAVRHGLARLSNHGVIVAERHKPAVTIGRAIVQPPPGAFRQATAAGETALAERVVAELADARRVADLFAGIGTFALRIAETAEVAAYDLQASALAALDRGARSTPGLQRVAVGTRNLFTRPLTPSDLASFDAVVLDPPRAGAETQMHAIAASGIGRVVSVGCDVQTFARDAAILVGAGFAPRCIKAIDQFRYTAHLEVVAAFRRETTRRKRRLLG